MTMGNADKAHLVGQSDKPAHAPSRHFQPGVPYSTGAKRWAANRFGGTIIGQLQRDLVGNSRFSLRTQRTELFMRHFPDLAPIETLSQDRRTPHLRSHACKNFQIQKAFPQNGELSASVERNVYVKRRDHPPRGALIAPNPRLRRIEFDSK